MYSSTCFGRPHAHHQELNNCGSNLWFYRWSVVVAVVGRGRADWPDHDQQHCYRHAPTVIPEAATAVVELLMMGVMPETCWAVHKRQVINLTAGPSGRTVWGVGLRPLACWDRGFESHRGAWMFVCCECCVLSGRGLCDELITRPEKSYRLWCVVVCDLETSRMRRPWPALGRSATGGGK